MSNLKRVLAMALVFALVMSLGFASFAATADGSAVYGDWSDVGADYQAEVLSLAYVDGGYFILQGDEEGNFNPNKALTRAEFATLAARVDMGGASRDGAVVPDATLFAAYKNLNRFSDVKSTDWFAGAVNYCSSRGIVNGYTDGTFKPDQLVRPTEVFKMLLVLLGFRGSEMTGTAWEAAVFTNMAEGHIYLGDKVYALGEDKDGNAGYVTRQEAAAALIVALNSDVVVGSAAVGYTDTGKTLLASKFKTVTIEGILVKNKYANIDTTIGSVDGDVFLQKISNDASVAPVGSGIVGSYYIINGVTDDDVAPVSMLGARVSIEVKAAGGDYYNYAGNKAVLKDLRLTVPLSGGDVYGSLASAAQNSLTGSGTATSYYNNLAYTDSAVQLKGTKGNWAGVFAKELYTEAYAFRFSNQSKLRNIFAIKYSLGKVTKIDGGKVTINNATGSNGLGSKDIANIENGSKLAVGDYIAYYKLGSADKYAYLPVNAFTGTMTTYNANSNTATIDGTGFGLLGTIVADSNQAGADSTTGSGLYNNIFNSNNINKTNNFNTERTYFALAGLTFSTKLIGMFGAASAPATYCIVLEVSQGTSGSAFSGYDKVQILKDDGSKAVYDLKKINGNDTKGGLVSGGYVAAVNNVNNGGGGDPIVNISNALIYSYTVNSDGTLELNTATYNNGTNYGTSTSLDGNYNTGTTVFGGLPIHKDAIWFARGNGTWQIFKGLNLYGAGTNYTATKLFTRDSSIRFGIVNTGSGFAATSGNWLYAKSEVTFDYVDGKLTAYFQAVDINTGADLGTINLIPGKKADGNSNIADTNSGAGIQKGHVLRYEVTEAGYKGDVVNPIDATSSSMIATSTSVAGNWYDAYIVSNINGTFSVAEAPTFSNGPTWSGDPLAFTLGVEQYFSTANTIVVDTQGPSLSNVTSLSTNSNQYYVAIIEIDPSNPLVIKRFVIKEKKDKF